MIRKLVLLFFLFHTVLCSRSQSPLIQFKQLTTLEGLSQSSVVAICQDRDDILWFGTRDGLNKYDGTGFTVFRSDADNQNSLSDNDIVDIVGDSDGDLWVATYNGLNLYDTRLMKFKRFIHIPTDQSTLSNNSVRSVVQMNDGKILAGSVHGLNLIDKPTGNVVQIFSDSTDANSLLDNNIYELFKDRDGNIWIGGARGISRLLSVSASGQYSFKRYDLEDRVQVITQDLLGNIWFGTKEKGLFKINAGSDEPKHFSELDLSGKILNNDVRALATDDQGFLWVGTYDGVSRIGLDGSVQNLQHDPLRPGSISKNTIKSIYKDRTGSVWVGVYYGGINVWNEANNNFRSIKELANGQGLSYDVVSSIVEDEQHLYFGTEGGGISILDKKTDLFSYLSLDDSKQSSDNVKSLYIDSEKQEIWVGTFSAGVFIWDLQGQKASVVLNTESGLGSNSIYDIKPFENDNFWIGTFGGGLSFYNRNTNKILSLRHDPNDNTSLCDDQVRTILVDSKRNLWIGTQDGLSFLSHDQFQNQKHEMINYFHDPKSGLGEDVLVIFEDSRGMVWVGTKETGLHSFKDNTFIPVDLFDQFKNLSKTINSILEDDLGVLWISSNNGIIRYDPIGGDARLFEESDGLVSNEFNNNSSLKSISGDFYFGGPDGVSSFNPYKIKGSEYTSRVILTGLKVYNESIIPGDSTGILDKSIAQMGEIELRHDEAIFTIEFALPSYINPDKNSYAFRLIGLEEKWKYTPTNEASFTIQDPGKYVFEVKGCSSDGIWNPEPTSLIVVVRPAAWRAWWAFLLYACAIAVALYFLLKIMQSRAELRHDLELGYKENEQQKTLNKMKLDFFTNVSHEFRTPLTLILGPLQQIISEYRGSNALFKQLIVIQQNANQLLKLINQLMEFRKLQNNQAELKAANGNIVKFAKEVFLSFKPYAQSEGYDYRFRAEEEEIMVYYDRDKMERVFYNLISNAFKYTKERKQVEIQVARDKEVVRFKIIDAGVGLHPESIDRIFDRFYQVRQDEQSKSETSKGTGIGLALSKGIVDLHKGVIDVESKYGEGSTFIISLPLGSSHLSSEQIIENFKDSEDLSLYDNYQTLVGPNDNDISKYEEVELSPNRKSILVVEDNQQVRKFIISLLSAQIYDVHEASNGMEGLQLIENNLPDLIISDVMMPEMDGIELCSLIKSNIRTSHVPVILLTARTSLIFRYEGLESGADDYINKPFNIKELQLKVKNLLMVMDKLKEKFKTNETISPSDVTISSIDEELLKKSIAVVDNNISNEFFDVPFFCSELGVSRTMLFTKIKAWTNMTPNDFIQSMRMKRAAQLLEQGKINVSQICFNVGYKNPKYFSKTFQKHHHMTPTEYAQKFRIRELGHKKADSK